MSYEDKVLECKGCGGEFVFSVKEQEFYAEKGFDNIPQRCKPCRDKRKKMGRGGPGGGGGGGRRERPSFAAVCTSCGVQTKVPFEPSPSKPVYCRDCFKKSRGL